MLYTFPITFPSTTDNILGEPKFFLYLRGVRVNIGTTQIIGGKRDFGEPLEYIFFPVLSVY